MKTGNKINVKFIFAFVAFANFALLANSQKLEETYTWQYNVNTDVMIYLKNYDCDLDISTSNTKQVTIKMEVVAEAEDQESLDKLDNYIKTLEFKNYEDRVILKTRFWKKMGTFSIPFFGSKTYMELENGEKLKVKEFKQKATIIIPVKAGLSLDSKYSSIRLPDLRKLDIDCYNDKVYAGNIEQEGKIEAKYSKLEFGNTHNWDINFYDSRLIAKKTGNLEIESKYSEIEITTAGSLDLISYQDDYQFHTTGNVEMEAKYSDFSSEESNNLDLNIYDSDIDIQKAGEFKLKESKYSKYEIGEVKDITIISSYDDAFSHQNAGNFSLSQSKYSEFEAKNIGTVTIGLSYDDIFRYENAGSLKINESKYTDFKVGILKKYVKLVGYDDNVTIDKVSEAFEYLDVEEKYATIRINTPKDMALRLDTKTKYGGVKFNENAFTTKVKVKDNSDLEYKGIKGKETEGMPYIKLRGYDSNLYLNY